MSDMVCSALAEVRDKIPLPKGSDEAHLQAFKRSYDRLYSEFQGNLMAEYKMMKEKYLLEYSENF